MKTLLLEETTLDHCVRAAQSERVVLLRKGKPVAKPKAAAPFGQWKKTCPSCNRQVAARRYACDCGHKFEPTAGA